MKFTFFKEIQKQIKEKGQNKWQKRTPPHRIAHTKQNREHSPEKQTTK